MPRLKAAAAQAGVTIEKILLTHGHIDHCGGAGIFAEELGVPIEGPHEEDRFWIDRLAEDGGKYGIAGRPFEPSRWLDDGDQVTVGDLTLNVAHCPGHTPGHIVFHHPEIEPRAGRRRAVPRIGRPLGFPARRPAAADPLDHGEALADGRRDRLRARPRADVDLRPRASDQSVRRGCGARLGLTCASGHFRYRSRGSRRSGRRRAGNPAEMRRRSSQFLLITAFEGAAMAVPKRKTSPSKRNMRRSHHALTGRRVPGMPELRRAEAAAQPVLGVRPL